MISKPIRRPRKTGKPSWRVILSRGYDADGKRVYESHTFSTKGEAEAFIIEWNARPADSPGPVAAPQTVNEFLDHWMSTHVAQREYYTGRRYRSLLDHLRPAVGSLPLKELTAEHLEAAYVPLYQTLSARTVRNIHGCIRSALGKAVKSKRIPFNPALGCTLRPSDTKESKALEADDLQRIEQAASPWLAAVLALAGDTGLRRGELLALRWSDLDYQSGRLMVSKSVFQRNDGQVFEKATKNRTVRNLTLGPATIARLRMHQEAQRVDARMFGADYRWDMDLIFASPTGEYIKPETLSITMRRLAKRLGMSKVGIHTFRHSHASLLISNGVPLPVVSKRLGHSSPHTTAKIYSHALPADDQAVAEIWDKLRHQKSAAESPQMVTNGNSSPGDAETRHQKPN